MPRRTPIALLTISISFFISGCSYYAFRNPDGTLPNAQSYFLCNDEASKLLPPHYVNVYFSGYRAPTETVCSKDGECIEKEGAWVEGHSYDIDKNKEGREDLFISCMLAKGYVLTKIKRDYSLKDFFSRQAQ